MTNDLTIADTSLTVTRDTVDWLMDSDPAIRWQVMRDLLDSPADEVANERGKVAVEGWGARLLALQDPDTGLWGGGTFAPLFTSTFFTLKLLHDLGLDPDSEQARRAIPRVRDARWDYDRNMRFFEGEVEPCINGRVVTIGAYFGEDVRGVVDRLLGEQMADGGWNCEQENGSVRGSFDTSISVLEGLLEYERAIGPQADVTAARQRGETYLLDRHLFRRQSTGEVVTPRFLQFSFPTYWFYDVLRGLDYLRDAGVRPDERVDEAIQLVKGKPDADGRWPLENVHREGTVHFELDGAEGTPSRWNTLRALRVLRWYEGSPGETLAETEARQGQPQGPQRLAPRSSGPDTTLEASDP